MIDAQQWKRVQLLMDLVVLFLASSCALFAEMSVREVAVNRWLAAVFPVAATAMMRARRPADERLNTSLVDELAYVLGVISLAAMLTIAVNSIFGTVDPVALPSRLWLFSLVY
ncbi:MAG: hypothetical protein ACRDLV_15480, partial [Solirubrobacteraceae bacterium]